MANDNIGWENIDEITKMFSKIPEQSREKEMQKIFAKTLRQEVLKKVKSQLSDDFKSFVKIKKNSGFESKEDIVADTAVGIHKDAYPLRFLVYGTEERTTRHSNRYTGAIKPGTAPSIDQTMLNSKDSVTQSVFNDFIKNVKKTVKRYT